MSLEQMSKNQISGSKGLHLLNGTGHFRKPSLVSFFLFSFPRQCTLLESQIKLHIMYLLLLKCLETSMATAYPQEKAQRFGLTFKASSICLPETSPTFSPAAPLHTVYSLLQRTLPVGPVCTQPWKNQKTKKMKDVNLIGGVPSQLNYNWWAGWRLSCQLSLHPTIPWSQLNHVSFIFTGPNIHEIQHAHVGRLSAKHWDL